MKTIAILSLACLALSARADLPQSDANRLADAIYKAEGGAATRFPYGISTKYRHTTPRQACINTIQHAHRDWVKAGSNGDYLVFLAKRYSPLSQYWLKNVRHFYLKSY